MPETFSTERLPSPKGPYSQAMKAGDFLFVSGMVAVDARSGEAVTGGIEEQVRAILDNLKTLLHDAGASLGRVVKTTVYLADLKDLEAMNAAYAKFFTIKPPARTTVQASPPMGFRVEIDAVAWLRTTE